MSQLIMSMSGIRGVIGESLDPSLALKVGKAFGTYLKKGPVIVGGDTRVSHDMVKSALISGLLSVGVDVIEIGKVPTPTVQQMIQYYNASGGIVVTASHNPIMWNGLKLMNGKGSFLEPDEYEAYFSVFQSDNFPLKSWDQLGQISYDGQAIEKHVDKLCRLMDTSTLAKSNLKVLIDANNGTGALADPILLDRLGVDYDILYGEPSGRFAHDPEPLEKNLTHIKEVMAKGGYDIGFVQDADADRLVILDEGGRFIGEDYSLGMSVDYVLQKEQNEEGEDLSVVVNLSTSKVIEDIAARYGAKTRYTKIGEINVYQGIKEHGAIVGGEGNGGVIYPKIGYGRDSLVGIVLALKYLEESGQKVSEIVQTYPRYILLREKVALTDRSEIEKLLNAVSEKYQDHEQNKSDGVKVSFPKGWLHVRASNTEPIVRIFAEAESKEEAQKLIESVKELA